MGRPEVLSLETLRKQFLAHQDQRTGDMWLRKDTTKSLFEAKRADAASKGTDYTCITPPDDKTVSAYHSTLMSMPEVAQRAGKYKPVDRDLGETSVRSVISDITGLLLLSAVIAGNMPREHHFCSERAGEGLLLGRDLLSKAFWCASRSRPLLAEGVDDEH
jgi:hypothetical protein